MRLWLQGTYFGESFTESSRRERTITAMCDSDLAYLRIEDLQELQAKFPELKAHVDRCKLIVHALHEGMH